MIEAGERYRGKERERRNEKERYQGTELQRGEMEGEKRCCEGMKWREREKREYATQSARERDSDVFVWGGVK